MAIADRYLIERELGQGGMAGAGGDPERLVRMSTAETAEAAETG